MKESSRTININCPKQNQNFTVGVNIERLKKGPLFLPTCPHISPIELPEIKLGEPHISFSPVKDPSSLLRVSGEFDEAGNVCITIECPECKQSTAKLFYSFTLEE